MGGSLAEQARRKGFTKATHRIGTDQYPITVRPDPSIPKGWIVIDTHVEIPYRPDIYEEQMEDERRWLESNQ